MPARRDDPQPDGRRTNYKGIPEGERHPLEERLDEMREEAAGVRPPSVHRAQAAAIVLAILLIAGLLGAWAAIEK